VIRKISKGFIIIFIIFWMFNCASGESRSGAGIPQKEKPADEVDLAPRPTRLKK
jgi:hypothetical protein